MRTITVELGEKTYNIEIAAGLLDQIGAKARVLSQAVKAAIISDSTPSAENKIMFTYTSA